VHVWLEKAEQRCKGAQTRKKDRKIEKKTLTSVAEHNESLRGLCTTGGDRARHEYRRHLSIRISFFVRFHYNQKMCNQKRVAL
jgi:hypothetical protein